jgi:putative transcriptional regulator
MLPPAKGTILIAEPFLKDPNFSRTVILLCEHQEEGSFGFVLNRTIDNTLNELMPDRAADLDLPVWYGGPVQKDSLHFLHQYPDLIPGGANVADGVWWGGDFETAVDLLRSGGIERSKIRFFVGYSGWSGGQLDGEMQVNSWLTVEANRKLVFPSDPAQTWKDSLRLLGGEYEMMINFPTDPSLN